MKRPTHLTNKAKRASAGFSLVEILLSLGIFAIGMTAIVSLFPAAAILQRETAQEVISDMAAQSAAAIIDANKLTYQWDGAASSGNLSNYYSVAGYADTDAVPLYAVNANMVTNRFSAGDRSYPTGLVNITNINNCDLHWVPFIQDLNGDQTGTQNWVMRLFIVESDSRATYTGNAGTDANPLDPTSFPKVRYLSVGGGGVSGAVFTLTGTGDLETGDIIMDSNGNDHVITDIDGNDVTVVNDIPTTPREPDKVWYAPRQGGTYSPAQRVITIEVEVVEP